MTVTQRTPVTFTNLMIAMRTELETLVQTWRANADTREALPKNTRDTSAAVTYRICADEIEALLTKGPQ